MSAASRPPAGTAGLGTAASLAFLPLLVLLLWTKNARASLVLLVLSNAALLVEALSLSR